MYACIETAPMVVREKVENMTSVQVEREEIKNGKNTGERRSSGRRNSSSGSSVRDAAAQRGKPSQEFHKTHPMKWE